MLNNRTIHKETNKSLRCLSEVSLSVEWWDWVPNRVRQVAAVRVHPGGAQRLHREGLSPSGLPPFFARYLSRFHYIPLLCIRNLNPVTDRHSGLHRQTLRSNSSETTLPGMYCRLPCARVSQRPSPNFVAKLRRPGTQISKTFRAIFTANATHK